MNTNRKIIEKAIKTGINTAEELNSIKRLVLRSVKNDKKIPTTANLLKAYHKLLKENKIKRNKLLEEALTKRAVRTLSGVSIVTVLTEPFQCPGECIYCPNEKSMPKSYIADEPAAARALALHFDPYEQVAKRIESLAANGHPTDKIELIVKGGTWNVYPIAYKYWFILRCFEACNNSRAKTKKNAAINILKKKLAETQNKNEKAKHRIIGLTLETRPDQINIENILIMRELGCTRVELGVQTIDDKILRLIKRGHDTDETVRATQMLKNYGFKVDYHLMPQLPGTTPDKDLKMMQKIFSDQAYRPDMIKIYPCTVVENSELYDWFKAGQYLPYSNRALIDTIKKFKTTIPRYARVSRLIRDIPAHHIKAGNTVTNLRQVILKEMTEEGKKCYCLRCREIGHLPIKQQHTLAAKPLKLFIEKYKASGGIEYFLSFEDSKRQAVFAFCRLRLDVYGAAFPAFIRELHVYGQSLMLGAKEKLASQHKGLGKKLISAVEKICRKNKITTLAVISGVGVRDYYRKLGYKKSGTYMVKLF
jgi:elongator complex protein 3